MNWSVTYTELGQLVTAYFRNYYNASEFAECCELRGFEDVAIG